MCYTTLDLIKGDKTTDRHSTYKMVFIRKTGVKTKEGSNIVNTTKIEINFFISFSPFYLIKLILCININIILN